MLPDVREYQGGGIGEAEMWGENGASGEFAAGRFKVDTFVNEHYPEFAELRTLEKTLQEELEK